MKNPTIIKLKQIGLRVTPQRQAILELLEGNRFHPSAEDIYHEVLKKYPQISFATVYNTLSKLAGAYSDDSGQSFRGNPAGCSD